MLYAAEEWGRASFSSRHLFPVVSKALMDNWMTLEKAITGHSSHTSQFAMLMVLAQWESWGLIQAPSFFFFLFRIGTQYMSGFGGQTSTFHSR